MEPLISLTLRDPRRIFQPGDELECEYQIDAVPAEEIQAIEASVLWYTEGKGDEDLAVHYFERRVPGDAENGDLRPLRRFHSRLPNSPLSYNGAIVKIRWCVRVRLFLRRGKEVIFERPFQLGSVPAPVVVREHAAAETEPPLDSEPSAM
jgi:hypothetical protein